MRKLFIALFAMFALVACSSGTSTDSGLVDATAFQTVTEKPDVVVVDVRTPAEYASGHLPNAVNIDVESPTFSSQIAKLDPNAEYAVYCRSGNRSQTAVAQMSDAGLTQTSELDGGILAWQAQGLPIVR